jgi:flagellar protein FlbT
MTKSFRVWLRPGEKIYINGAVLRADRKVSLEFLNDVTFLLETHVLQAKDTTTPLRQLYFVIQMMLIEPACKAQAQQMFGQLHARLLKTFENQEVLDGLHHVGELMEGGRCFEALKVVRSLFPVEEQVLRPPKLDRMPACIQLEAVPCE